MDQQEEARLATVAVGQLPTEEHIRVWEAWLREFPQPPGTIRTAKLLNEAVDWWNGLKEATRMHAALLASRRSNSLAMPTGPDADRIHVPAIGLPTDAIEIKLPDLSRVALEPGDTLLLRCAGLLSDAQVHLIKLRLSQAFPGHEIVMISSDVEVSVVRPLRQPED